MMNKTKGNMYSFVTHTWNPVKGKCSHDCSYCYMKRWPQKRIRLVGQEFKTKLGENNFVFVGSSTDLFANDVPSDWIQKTLFHCVKYYNNKYLFQTKNTKRFEEFKDIFPKKTILGTTMETNREYTGKCLTPILRAGYLAELDSFERMVTVEPIMDFDLEIFVDQIKSVNPSWVNIGADSQGHGLPEPSKEKILALIKELESFTTVKKKDNLKRLMKNE